MVIERAKRDFLDDIAIIGLTGSFSTGDFHEKSDLDLIIINNTERGWGISDCFILDDVGYDIYCTPFKNTRAIHIRESQRIEPNRAQNTLLC
nr:nucleotidyltransferase domain-containing protein [Paenibacillus taichungensis]